MHWNRQLATVLTITSGTVVAVTGCGDNALRATVRADYADTVLRNGIVATIDQYDSIHQAVAVRDGKIVDVGSDHDADAWIGSSTKVIDLGGRLLLPGFIDAHLHALAGGRAVLQCDLNYKQLTQAALTAALQACLDASPEKEPDTWLEAVNWDRQATSAVDRDPTKALLDGLRTRRPIVMTSSDFHTVLANSRALSAASITAATPDPVGGKFVRANGELTGICEDQAGFVVKAVIPPDTDADLLKQGRAALAVLRAQGITSFMDAAAAAVHGTVFKSLQQSNELTARVNLAINLAPEVAAADPAKAIADAKQVASAIDQGAPTVAPGLNARIVKIFADGVVNAPGDTGALLTPYFTNTGTAENPNWVPGTNLGSLHLSPDVLKALMLAANTAGMDVHLHATGERAVRVALDAAQNLRTQRPGADFRLAIAHDETVAVADYPRFAALDVMATMSFQWAQRFPSSSEDALHLGADRFSRMEPSGSLRSAGAMVVHGSDWPIDPFNTLLALKAGVTRTGDTTQTRSTDVPLNAEPGLSRADVLRAITMNAAHQLRLDDVAGSIEVGKFADLIVLERNFLEVPDTELARNRVLLTMVGGNVVMALGDFASTLPASQRERNARVHVLSYDGATGHAMPPHAKGAPHGDGHMVSAE